MPQFQTFPEALQHWAQNAPDSPAFVFRDKSHQRRVLTWTSVYTLSGCFAAVLRAQGTARGGLVINTLPNSPERVLCETGIWMAGAASVNAQCLMADGSDLFNTVNVSRAPIILLDPDVTNSPWHVLKNHVIVDDGGNVTSSLLPCLKKVMFVRRVENEGQGDFIGQLKRQEEWYWDGHITSKDVFSVFTTSGTTGFSKLVKRAQGPFIKFLQGNSTVVNSFTAKKIQLNMGPLGWLGGCIPISLVGGATRVACDMRTGTPENMAQFLWDTIQDEKCLTAYLSPTYIPDLAEIAKRANQKNDADTTSTPWKMDTILVGGLPIMKSVVEAGLQMAESVYVAYGGTEMGTVCGHLVDDSQGFTDKDVGLPFEGVEVKVVRVKDESKHCVPGEVGHILVKGTDVMKGYLNSPEVMTEAFTEDGFFRTGDFGRFDEQGHLIVDGRGSDAIMKGAYIFYPTWIESSLRKCPGLRDVVVVGVPDPVVREELCACVVLESEDVSLEQVRHTADTLFLAKDDLLSPCPRHYLQFTSFPVTSFGKPQRNLIKTQAAQRLGLIPKAE